MKDLDKISTRLKIAKNKVKNNWEKNNNPQGSYLGVAFKISTELVAAVFISSIIGFILDGWFDTKPLLIIIFFFIGVAAGILNVIRSAKKMQKQNNKKEVN